VSITARADDRHDLQEDDEVDHAKGRSKPFMRGSKPIGHHAIFADAIQDAIRSDNRRIYRSRQHQETHNHDEALKQQLQRHWPSKIKGDTADYIVKVLWAH